MRVTALVRFSAALLHSRPQERCGTKRQGHHAALQASHARRHGCARWPVPIARGPLLHARSAGGGDGGGWGQEMVESVSLASECGSQPTRRHESNAVVSPPSSHSAGLNCPGNPGHNPANHLRAQLGGARTIRPRRGSWLIGAWGLGGAAGKSKLGEHHHAGCGGEGGRGLREGEEGRREGGREGGGRGGRREGTGVRWEANVLQRADQQNRHRLASPPLAVAAFLCVSLPGPSTAVCPSASRHRLLVTAIVPAKYGTI